MCISRENKLGGDLMRFDVKGYNIDNLIVNLYSKRIPIYNLERKAYNYVSFTVEDKYIKKVKRYIVNFKVSESLTGIKKLPKIIAANVGLLLGVFIGVLFYLFSSNYIWQIRVYGTKELSSNDILNVLEENGIKTGKLNLKTQEEIEGILLNNYDRIAQVSVIKKGTAIIINLSEKLVYLEEEFLPVTAQFNGIIKEINVITGTVNVKVGDYVNVGDILVLPFNLDKNNNKISVKPIAEIKGEIYIIGKCVVAKEEQVLVRTGKSCVEYKYKLLDFNLFSGKAKNSFALFETNVYNENIGTLLPFTRDVVKYYELNYQTITHNFEAEKQKIIERSRQDALQKMPAGNILNEISLTTIINDVMHATTTFTIYGILNG